MPSFTYAEAAHDTLRYAKALIHKLDLDPDRPQVYWQALAAALLFRPDSYTAQVFEQTSRFLARAHPLREKVRADLDADSFYGVTGLDTLNTHVETMLLQPAWEGLRHIELPHLWCLLLYHHPLFFPGEIILRDVDLAEIEDRVTIGRVPWMRQVVAVPLEVPPIRYRRRLY